MRRGGSVERRRGRGNLTRGTIQDCRSEANKRGGRMFIEWQSFKW